ncbi:hypothetical protein BJV74DRAFT_210934 [Russula compacta]|nr:hypothetical protein BJV74DRAFT_210934 [Russula compacta]
MTTLVVYSGLSHPLFSLSPFAHLTFFFSFSIVVVVIKCRYPWRSLFFSVSHPCCASLCCPSLFLLMLIISYAYLLQGCVFSRFTSLSFPSSRVQSSPHSLCVPFYFALHVKYSTDSSAPSRSRSLLSRGCVLTSSFINIYLSILT